MKITTSFRSAVLILVTVSFFVLPVHAFSADESPDYKELRLFRMVMQLVQKNYVKDVSDKDLIQGAITGMLQSLDPHSSYMTEEMFKELQVETKGEFEGLGIEITLENGVLTIISPIEDTPAFKAGLKPGDKIIKIDGEPTKNITLVKAVKKMRGPKDSKVTLTIMREGFKKFKDFEISRAKIHVKSVKKELIEPGYPYVRIANFQETTETDLADAIKDYGEDDKIKGLVLDLRNNPGGLLDQAWKVSNLFVDRNALIVYTDGRAKDQRMDFRATKSGKHYKFKIAVLINKGSASASEIVAGALQDYDRAVVFGTKSFGKASVQTIIPLGNGSGLRLTTAYYYTPKGRHIQKTGIHPDVDLEQEVTKQEEADLEEESKPIDQKKRKDRYLRSKADPEHDPVLKKALEWLKSDIAVKQYKLDNQKPPIPETAALNEK
ncbi:S41 family peptidase [Desulfomonile tiedjei]|uniref:C-terminal processing peptidase n=1 Tax=Desulfomonile tiedjei (strain ATCC 49306 / DSM 6799 / DCB-1) TaxID=706587 RepID=I4BZT4_DESTA|nr:S41 family peptidase [Desulfomonile tiedjei]AFM22825.1 C-terminal processing peptidase [Desulfomonile tiedjei DSM 6799]